MKTDRARLYRWQKARAREVDESLRERAFLPLPEKINGVVVKQFTLRHLAILSKIQSPFIYGGTPKIEDVGVFLWVVSPHYSQEEEFVFMPFWKMARRRLLSWLQNRPWHIPTKRELFMAELVLHPRFQFFYRAIPRYLHRVFRDKPPETSGAKEIATCYSAAVIYQIAADCGMSPEEIMETPLHALFQLMKWKQIEDNPATPQFNPMQDWVDQKFMD